MVNEFLNTATKIKKIMSYPESVSSDSLSPISKTGTSSFRVRQMVSMLVLVALGISLLGGGYLSIYNANQRDELQTKLRDIAAELVLVTPLFSDEGIHTPADKVELGKFLKQHGFSDGQDDNGTEKELYAYFLDSDAGHVKWQSKFPYEPFNSDKPGWLNGHVKLLKIEDNPLGKDDFQTIQTLVSVDGEQKLTKYVVYSKVLKVEDEKDLRLVLAKSATGFINDGAHVQNNIIALFFSTLALVLIAQLISNYFIITPIKDFETEVKQIEAGDQDAILKAYPVELTEVKSAINTLINVEKGQKRRYRESLDNLAHSLKTPLAEVLSAQSKYDMKADDQEDLKKSINHMCDIVAYQLKRAAVRTPNAIIRQQVLRPVLYRLRDSLYKVYHDKSFEIKINVDDMDKVRVENDDLIELFGNLMNNACRFCDSVVEVTAASETNFLVIDIDDDGMGFGGDSPTELLQRGMRDDSKTDGQGIGLAISAEIVEAVGGKIELKMSPQVGARVRLYLPH